MLAQETGSYRERPVRSALREHFSHVWVHQLPTVSAGPIVIVPDGASDLQWIQSRWRVAGPDQGPQTETLQAGAVVIGFRFQPGSAPAWLGAPLSEFRDARVWLDDIGGHVSRQFGLADAARSHADLVDALESTLARRAGSMPSPDTGIRRAYRLLSAGLPPGRHVVPWLMAEFGLSERTLRRRFGAVFGYGPKTLDRVLRFQRYLGFARMRNPASAADLAVNAGYADQAHLVRECRRLALCTPSQINYGPMTEWDAESATR